MRAEEMKAERGAQLIDRGLQLFVAACHESGVDVSKARPTSAEELKRNAYSDRYDVETDWL